ncbi:hypothetical protein N7495_002884 [Penicillium taxi]|uniref:uncharacterized protein n=1 Tax=Penicillium taxi TaxID=168475 RepID=UPI0025456571|nr:uncharacterized protein N7495_002884 [Penicillium taxi]KAJ5902356.1 hypothetical protein N7495_002884 [Penicillium taxi]
MHTSIPILLTLAVSVLGGNYTFPAGFNIGLIDPQELTSWCLGERNVCPSVCQGSTKQNSCDPSTLNFDCVCSDGTAPDMSQYMQSIPFYVCEASFGQCIDSHPNDAMGQEACKKASSCGTKNASATETTSSSTATATLSTSTDTDSTKPSVSSSSSVAAASSTSTKNAALPHGGLIEDYSTTFMASVMLLAMRLVL